jgi:glycosyltransferase involved in cell wall biosynthesis
MNILQISTADYVGGAARIAWLLHQAYNGRGHRAWMTVRQKDTSDPRVVSMPSSALGTFWSRGWQVIGWRSGKVLGGGPTARLIGRCIAGIGSPRRLVDDFRGHEYFNFPASRRTIQRLPIKPDIIHCHNLHGDYFDLRFLPQLCQMAPVVMTLHDEWTFTGHCAHSFNCDRWKTGCGECPDLSIPPELIRDGTAFNWQRKREIYAKCRLYVATPSQWLMDKVQQSILQPAIIESRVIPNGIDQSIFHPGDRLSARRKLGLPESTFTLSFAANGIRNSVWKDWQTMRRALEIVAAQHPDTPINLLAIGETAHTERLGNATITFIPHTSDQSNLADYYRAADVYLHAAKADTFPNTVIEALSCGTPVVATAVGGIPEQVRGLMTDDRRPTTDDHGGANSRDPAVSGLRSPVSGQFDLDQASGVLTPPGDAEAMAHAIDFLIRNPEVRKRLGENAARDAKARFSLERMVNEYLEWYQEILAKRESTED